MPTQLSTIAFPRFFFGLAELAITFVLGVLIVFVSYRLLVRMVSRLKADDQIAGGNVSVGIMMAALVFGVVILVKRALYPVFTVLKDLFLTPDPSVGTWATTLAFALGYIVLSFLVALGIAVAALRLFDLLTRKVKELDEIRNNNVAMAIFFAGIYLSMTYFIEEGLFAFLVILIPDMAIRN